jgi:hypothetical protein
MTGSWRRHDEGKRRHSGMVRQHQTRNLEIPGSTPTGADPLASPRNDWDGKGTPPTLGLESVKKNQQVAQT